MLRSLRKPDPFVGGHTIVMKHGSRDVRDSVTAGIGYASIGLAVNLGVGV